jgi:fatty acid elongase 3
MLVALLGLYSCATAMWIPLLLNTFVHIVMYYYYLLVCLGYPVWWKMYLTDLQIFQFVIDIVSFTFWLYIYWFVMIPAGKQCSGSFWGGVFAYVVLWSFLFLFTRLRMQNARKESQRESNKKSQ